MRLNLSQRLWLTSRQESRLPHCLYTIFHSTTNNISLLPPSAGIVAALAVLAAMGLWLCLRRRRPPGSLGDIEMPGPPGSTAPSYFPLLPNGLRSDNEVRALRGH